jgi:hypothetical protein
MFMRSAHLRVASLIVAGWIASATIAWSQPKPLNPLVARAATPSGAAPAECEEGLSAAPALRVDVSQIPAPVVEPAEAAAVAPPSGTLRSALQDAQTALMRNDRPSFDAALVREKALAASHPAGNERRAAEEIVRLHEAAARLWDAQFRSPYFGEDDPVYAVANAFPGYAQAARRGALTDASGRRFYPAAESRDFLVGLAGDRLKAIGVRVTTTQVTRNAPAPSSVSAPATTKPKPRTTTAPAPAAPTKKRKAAPRKPATPKPAAETKTAVTKPVPAPPPPAPAPATATTAAVTTSSATPTTTDLAPITSIVSTTSATSSTETSATGLASSDTASTDTNLTTDTSLTTANTSVASATDAIVDTASSHTTTAAPPAQGRSLLLPTILILIGLGVLVVLFRASN